MHVRGLTSEEQEARDDAIALAAEYLAIDAPPSLPDVQTLYDVIAADHPEDTTAQIAAGIAFGAIIADRSGFDWVRIIDDVGEETGLCHPDNLVVCYPVSILQKRIVSGDAVDLLELCDATISAVNDAAATGDYKAR